MLGGIRFAGLRRSAGLSSHHCSVIPSRIERQRNMSTSTKNPYLLNLDEEASKRLNLQHNILSRMLGGKLIPDPVINHLRSRTEQERLQSYDWPACKEVKYVKIADVATGTGIWLYSIREELEKHDVKAELHGYDLHNDQFPPAEKREDVELHTLNILDTTKCKEIGGTYDYVHVRLLTSVLTKAEWKVAIDNCLEILRFGGYLHFEEIPFGELAIEKDGVPASGGVLEKLQASMKLLKRDLDCGNNIYNYLQELELHDTECRKINLRDCDEETKQMQNVNARLGLEEFITNAIARGPEALKRLGFDNEKAAREKMTDLGLVATQAQAYFVLYSIVGKKPGGSFVMNITARRVPSYSDDENEEENEYEADDQVDDADHDGSSEPKPAEDPEEPVYKFIVPRRGRFIVSQQVFSDDSGPLNE